jgi:hypothetical protein
MSGTDREMAVRVACFAAAGSLQADVAEIGAAQVTEADLRRALQRALQAHLGPVVRVEVPVPKTGAWAGRLGAFDVAVSGESKLPQIAIEVKWCRQPVKVGEAIWDALKLCPLSDPGATEASATYMVYAAPTPTWHSDRLPVSLFTDAEHDVKTLLNTYADFWAQWLPAGPNSPRVEAVRWNFTTSHVATVPIREPSGGDWELRCVRVQSTDSPMLIFDGRGVVADDQPALGPKAPPERFIDTAEDISIDPATLPENKALAEELKQYQAKPDA